MAIAPPSDLAGLCGSIELLVLDVDGVLTDGAIVVDDRGVESKHFHVRDGGGIALWRKSGKKVAIVSGRSAACVEVRAPICSSTSPGTEPTGSSIFPTPAATGSISAASTSRPLPA